MKLIRRIALTALVTFTTFGAVTFTSCNPDKCKDVVCQNNGNCNSEDGTCTCPTGFDGANCQTEVRNTYDATYKGNGTDSDGDTYTGWSLKFDPVGTDPTAMTLTLQDENGAQILQFTVHLNSNSTYTVDEQTTLLYKYTGSGTVNTNVATLTLTENELGTSNTLVFTFNNMVKQENACSIKRRSRLHSWLLLFI